MRWLAGSLLYFIAALIVIYSASWMLLGFKDKAQGHTIKITHKGVFGVRITPLVTPTISYTSPISSSTPSPIPTLTPTPLPTLEQATPSGPKALSGRRPTPSAKQNSIIQITPQPTSQPTPTPTPTQGSTGNGNSSILDGINNFRVSKGLSRATSNPETCEFAKTRAGEISSAFNHDGFNQRISGKTLPYSSYSIVTENIAENSDPTQVINMWINSAPHAENMQKDTPFICVVQNGNYFAYEGWKP